MMNFLDLSSASEEERRLIKEILSDTSTVNIAEPKQANQRVVAASNQHQNYSNNCTKNDFTPNAPHITSSTSTNSKHRNINSNHHNSINSSGSSNSNTGFSNHVSSGSSSSRSSNNISDTTTNHHSANHNPHRSYNYTKNSNDRLRSNNDTTINSNQINYYSINNLNNDASNITTTNSSPVGMPMGQAGNLDQHHLVNTMPPHNVYNQHHQHHHPNTTAAHHHMHHQVLNQNLPTAKVPTLDPNNDAVTQTTSYHVQDTSIQTTTTTTTVTTADTHPGPQATSVPPTQAQMPPIHGDMNSVIGMDMTSSQPPGYAIPPHVTAFGPPPPHRIYGGQPIFHQPYHYLIPTHPYSPYMPYVALGPPNNVVPTRQQVPPQTNQPPGTSSATISSHSRNLNQSQQHDKSRNVDTTTTTTPNNAYTNYHATTNQHQNIQVSFEPNIDASNGGGEMVNLASCENPDIDTNNVNVHEQSFKISKISSEQPQNSSPDRVGIKDCNVNQVSSRSTNVNGEEMVKLSADEGFETQSSLDVSKQSNDSSIPHSDQVKMSVGHSDKTTKERVQRNPNDGIKNDGINGHSNNDENSPSENAQSSGTDRGVWASVSSKSWASLFKPGCSPLQNGEADHNNISGSDQSDEENKVQHPSKSTKVDSMMHVNNVKTTSKEQRSHEVAKRALDKMAPRLAQKITSINLKHSLPFLKPRGFINKGNGCYINATLQALIACPPFYNLMKEVGVLRRENSCTPILDSFAELFLNFPPLDTNKKNKQAPTQEQQKLNINNLQAEAIEPKCIYKVLGHIKSECLKGAQEDAEEFLSSVLNGLHEEMIGLSETLQSTQESALQNGNPSDIDDMKDDIANDDNLWREVGPKNRSLPIRTAKVINTPIQEIFGGSLFSIRTAGKDRCGHRSPFFDLQLDISGDNVKSLQDAIKSFTAPEVIHDFYCTKTKQKLDAQRRTSLDQLPPILILHLKQFVYTQDHGLKKLIKKIEYPVDFELPEYCLHDKSSTDKSLRTSRSYKLLAVVYHDGKEAVKGHYLTDVYHIGSSQWIRCDDSNLKVIQAPHIENPDSTRTPYLLFYRRLNTLVRTPIGNHINKKKS